MPLADSTKRYQLLCHILLFLFPLAGNSVRSWTGGIFALLCITGLFFLGKTSGNLTKAEKLLLLIVLAVFAVFVISGLTNGWDYQQTKGLGVYVRWLLFIPIYLLIRDHSRSFFWLASGTVVASAVLFTQGIVDIYFNEFDRAYGAYGSPGLIGFQSLVFVITLVGAVKIYPNNPKFLIFFALGLFAALASIFLSGSRSTYFAVLLLIPCVIFIFTPLKKVSLSLSLFCVVAGLAYLISDFVADRVQSGLGEISNYLQDSNPASVTHGSVGSRLEMWKASLMIARDNPIWGVGWRNFEARSIPFVEQGLVSVSASHHPHPHNMFLEILVTAGICGLFVVVALLIHGARVARSSTLSSRISGNLLLVFILSFSLNGINEGGALAYGNALSFFLVYLAVLFSMTQISRIVPGG